MHTNKRCTVLFISAILSTTTAATTPTAATQSVPRRAVEFYDVQSVYSFSRMDDWWSLSKTIPSTEIMCHKVNAEILEFESYTEISDFVYFFDYINDNFGEDSLWTNARRVAPTVFRWSPYNDFDGSAMWCDQQPQKFDNVTNDYMRYARNFCVCIDYEEPHWCFRSEVCNLMKRSVCEKKKHDFIYVAPEYEYIGL